MKIWKGVLKTRHGERQGKSKEKKRRKGELLPLCTIRNNVFVCSYKKTRKEERRTDGCLQNRPFATPSLAAPNSFLSTSCCVLSLFHHAPPRTLMASEAVPA
jgi:hypothetical protein